MLRTRKSLSILIIAALALIPTSCSGGHNDGAKSSPGTLTTPKVTTSTTAVTTTAAPATTTTLPLILDAPRYQEYCSKDYPYCVEFPTVDGITEDDHQSYKAGEITEEPLDSIDFMFGVELSTGRVCTKWYEEHPECNGFDHMYYGVSAQPMPNKTADQALTEWLERSKQSMHALNHTTFAGSPAVTGQFGQLGTYTAFFRDGVLYEIATNGQVGRSYGEERFLNSFHWTNEFAT